jgi:hypothetical protein
MPEMLKCLMWKAVFKNERVNAVNTVNTQIADYQQLTYIPFF